MRLTIPAPVRCPDCCGCRPGCFLSGFGFEARRLEFIDSGDSVTFPSSELGHADDYMPPGEWVNVGANASPNWADFSGDAGLYFLSVFSELVSGSPMEDVQAFWEEYIPISATIIRHLGVIRATWGNPEVVWAHGQADCYTAFLLRSGDSATAFFYDRQAINTSTPVPQLVAVLDNVGSLVAKRWDNIGSTPFASGDYLYRGPGTKRWKLPRMTTELAVPGIGGVINPLLSAGGTIYYSAAGNVWVNDGVTDTLFLTVGARAGSRAIYGMVPYLDGFLVFGWFATLNGTAVDNIAYVHGGVVGTVPFARAAYPIIRAHVAETVVSLVQWNRPPLVAGGDWHWKLVRANRATGADVVASLDGWELPLLEFLLDVDTGNQPIEDNPPVFLPDGTLLVIEHPTPGTARVVPVLNDNTLGAAWATWTGSIPGSPEATIRSIAQHQTPDARCVVAGSYGSIDGETANGLRAYSDDGFDQECS